MGINLPTGSPQFNFSWSDLQAWIMDVLKYFVVPVALVFLTTYNPATNNLQPALYAAYGTGIALLINLLKKFVTNTTKN